MMVASSRKRRLSAQQRRALALLASNRRGIDEALLVANGFRTKMLARRLNAAVAYVDRVNAGRRFSWACRRAAIAAGATLAELASSPCVSFLQQCPKISTPRTKRLGEALSTSAQENIKFIIMFMLFLLFSYENFTLE
jgi:hypothetical protein